MRQDTEIFERERKLELDPSHAVANGRKRKAQKDRDLSKRPKKYKTWSDKSMTGAIKAVADGLLGINRAADEFGVPRSMLKDRISGKVVHGTLSGPNP